MRGLLASVIGAVMFAVCLAGCGSTPTVSYPRYQFMCCDAFNPQQVWHPGQALTLSWTSAPAVQTSSAQGETVTLTATLSGPYLDADSLKSGAAATMNLKATPITASDSQPGSFTSSIALPADLQAGFYNLTTANAYAGGETSGATVIQVR